MFVVNDDLSIYATRGDIVFFNVTAHDHGYPYKFKPGDIVRMSVYGKKDVQTVEIQKDFPVNEPSETVFIFLDEADTKIGDPINKYRDFWYEVVLNPDTMPQTLIGYDDDGPKMFRLFPESCTKDETPVQKEDVPVVDCELDMTSNRPIENRAVAIAIAQLMAAIEELKGNQPSSAEPVNTDGTVFNALGQIEKLSVLCIDAYGVAVKNGFKGTVEEWLASLKGEKGEKGDPASEEQIAEAVEDYMEKGIVAPMDAVDLLKDQMNELQTAVEDLQFVPIEIASISINVSKAEIGSTVSGVTVSWTFNRAQSGCTVTMNGKTVHPSQMSWSEPNVTATKKYTLKVTDEKGNVSEKSVSISFLNGVYYGASAIPATMNSAFVLGLKKELASTKGRTITVTASSGQYIWYALPVRLGKCTFTVGGFTGGFDLVDTIDFENNSGYTEQYYIYRSTNLVPGETKVVIS